MVLVLVRSERMGFAMIVMVPDYVLEGRSLEDFFDPASSEAIAGLHVPAAGETREDGCAVCIEDFHDNGADTELRTMPCSHFFHQRCIFRWLRVSRVCPCCRFPLPSAGAGAGARTN